MSSVSFTPFYDRVGADRVMGYPVKIAVSLGAGLLYTVLQYISLPDKMAFGRQYCWILGVIISTALLALYLATDLFRNNLALVEKLEGKHRITSNVMENWLTDRGYLWSAILFACVNTAVGYGLGVPQDFYSSTFSLVMIYSGFWMAGFACGMGVYGILGIMVLYLKLSPCLYYALDPMNPDGAGGIKRLGDALWIFGMLAGTVGLLVSIYMLGVQWSRAHLEWARFLLMSWVALPYLVAISMVLIPGLAVRRNVQSFKQAKATELRNEHNRIYSALKQFKEKGDLEIISENRELTQRLNHIQQQLQRLRDMRDSHIDRN
ncbi:MAG: hypothetical protein RLZZ385_2661 [Pseudomonadota bacterium]